MPMQDVTDWDAEEWKHYGKVYDFMVLNQSICLHPDCPPIKADHWRTISHNAAVLAVACANGGDFEVYDGQNVVASTETGARH